MTPQVSDFLVRELKQTESLLLKPERREVTRAPMDASTLLPGALVFCTEKTEHYIYLPEFLGGIPNTLPGMWTVIGGRITAIAGVVFPVLSSSLAPYCPKKKIRS